ncbi:P2Y purinoceptor 14-like [Salarias fasciatus]|uniref:P2Y purinoceptor 14-like n=1 Tax=Salarias fasciatus TaxID=181472 RepID=A0A672H892_SALFA|nr:P2Y purinoceptor 14-like [Salarias fasciatus]XP_029963635.1 P2Y purinoceptor 14-like [Salarias fasciatus]
MSHPGEPGTTTFFNWTSTSTTPPPCDLNSPANFFFAAFYSLVLVVGLLLNGFTLKVYLCGPAPTGGGVGVYLKNLAAADFFLCLCLPLRLAHFTSSSPSLQRSYCHVGAPAFYLNMYASILFMGYIAGNRYLKIVHPLGTHVLQTVRAAHLVSMVTWAFLLAMTCAYVALWSVTQRAVAPREHSLRCEVLHSQQLKTFYRVAHGSMAAIFLLVLCSLLFFYRRMSRRLAGAQRRQPVTAGSRRLARGRRNMLVLMGVFCVCFVPFHLVRLPYTFLSDRSCQLNRVLFYVKEVTTMLSVLNVCLDPLIYFIFCKAYRAQLGQRGAGQGAGQGGIRGALKGELSSTQEAPNG